MAIRVNYGDIQKMGQLAVEAGRAEGAVEAAELGQRERESARSAAVQMASINAATERQIRDIQHQNDMVEYRSWLDQEAEKRAMAWEVEKMELQARDRFELNEQEFAIKKQAEMFMEERKREERRRKFNALDRLLESGEITEDDHRKETIRLQLNLPAEASPFTPKTLEQTAAEQIRESMRRAAGIAPKENTINEVSPIPSGKSTTAAVYDLSLPARTRTQIDIMRQLDVDDDTYKEINRTIATKDPSKIDAAFNKLRPEIDKMASKESESARLKARGKMVISAFTGRLSAKPNDPLRMYREGRL
jgi:hypothetical protein